MTRQAMLRLYRRLTVWGKPLFSALLRARIRAGKEDARRLDERKGLAGRQRPAGPLAWVHAASVGEAQSALILIGELLKCNPALHVLVTTGTVTSAGMMEKKLPPRAFHQYCPLDVPEWVERFVNHWRPNLALWLESELWPNMLRALGEADIPAALVNARLSDKSFRKWRWNKSAAREVLGAFTLVLAQTEQDAERFLHLGAADAIPTDNLKYSARPLPAREEDLKTLSTALRDRPRWLLASTHKGEEALACRVHQVLKNALPDLLTIIVPRHTGRRDEIKSVCGKHGLSFTLRGAGKALPGPETAVYIADTMGELGLFYRAAPVAFIGRSLSDDGGGGHNPVEAAQLNCAVLHGPNVQFQKQIYGEMDEAGATLKIPGERGLTETLRHLLTSPSELRALQEQALQFARGKEKVVERVLSALRPVLEEAGIAEYDEWAEQA